MHNVVIARKISLSLVIRKEFRGLPSLSIQVQSTLFLYAMNGQIKGRDWLSLCVLFPMPVNKETFLLYASFVNGEDWIFVNFFQLHYSHSFSFFHELNRRRKHDIFYLGVETLSLIEKAKVSDKCWESSCPFVRIFPQLWCFSQAGGFWTISQWRQQFHHHYHHPLFLTAVQLWWQSY
jgi:hypothetical protein